MNKKIALLIALSSILAMMSNAFAADTSITFPQNKDYPGLFNVPDHIWGGENHDGLRAFYNRYMNLNGHTNGYLYEINLPGAGVGNVILMIGMGKEVESCDYMLSTSEAMGYGMIMAVILGDKEIFDGLLKTVQYYHAYNPDTETFNPGLTSWCIPGVKGSLPAKYKVNLPLSDSGADVVGPDQLLQGAPRDKSQCRSSATDGDQDIAYALVMAHWQWEAHAPTDKTKDRSYLEEARARYREISSKIVVEKVDVDGNEQLFLRTGDYFGDLNNSKENLTRPCDWTLTHYRTAFEIDGDARYQQLIQSIYSYLTDEKHPISRNALLPDFGWWDEKQRVLRVATDTAIENPEHMDAPVLEAANRFSGYNDSIQKWKPAGVLSDAYHWNACRIPWRLTLDAIHYGDHRSINEAKQIARSLYNSYGSIQKKVGTAIAHDYHQLPMGTTLDAGDYVKEWVKINPDEVDPAKIRYTTKDAIWSSTAFTTPYLLAYALHDPVEKKSEFLRAVKNSLEGFIGSAPEWCEAEWESDPYTNCRDPYYSGYYEDSINLLSLLTLAGDWWQPHGWHNNFSNPGFSEGSNGWQVIAENGIAVDKTIVTNADNQSLYIKITSVPKEYDIFDLKLVQSGVDLPVKPTYSFSMNVKRSGVESPNTIGITITPDAHTKSPLISRALLSVDQLPNTHYQATFPSAPNHEPARADSGETTITIGFGNNLKKGAEFWIDNLGLH